MLISGRHIFFALVVIHCHVSKAADTSQVFTFGDFMVQVLNHHPVAKQAALLNERARQEIRLTRGVLDPAFVTRFYQKDFDGRHYFTTWDNTLRIPTWYGIDVKAGFERNTGPFLNPQNNTPVAGLTYAGISVPLGQGLLIDDRRASIRQAQQLTFLAEAERIRIINNLLLQAATDYWDWTYYYYKWNFHREGYEFSSIRFEAVRQSFFQGDLPAIDTVEAMMQMQNFEIMTRQSEVEFRNYTLILSNHLWKQDLVPVELPENVIPSLQGAEVMPLSDASIEELISSAKINHPDIIRLSARLRQLEIERRAAADKFKPNASVEYNFLQAGFIPGGEAINGAAFMNNYAMGFNFSYPLFLRTERGRLQITKLRITETNFDLSNTNRIILNRIQARANEWRMLSAQIRSQEQLVQNSATLRNAEQIRFLNGESTIFLVNAREFTLISNQIRLAEMRSSYAKTKVLLQWSAGAVQP